MTTGEKIRALRKQMRLSQTELGAKVGVKKNAVSKWECGRVEDIPISTIKTLAEIFDVPASYLYEDDEKKTADTNVSGLDQTEYELLTPAHKAAVDNLIRQLYKSQSGE